MLSPKFIRLAFLAGTVDVIWPCMDCSLAFFLRITIPVLKGIRSARDVLVNENLELIDILSGIYREAKCGKVTDVWVHLKVHPEIFKAMTQAVSKWDLPKGDEEWMDTYDSIRYWFRASRNHWRGRGTKKYKRLLDSLATARFSSGSNAAARAASE